MRGFPFVLAIALLCPPLASSAQQSGRTVEEVRFSPAAQPLAPERLDRLVEVKAGAPLDPEAVRRSIHNLFQTGRYANIEVTAEEVEGDFAVIFRTAPNWFIGQVQARGADAPPTADQLLNVTRLRLGQLFTEEGLARAQQNLRQLLADNGYFTPVIRPELVTHPANQQVDVIFDIQTGPRAGIGRLLLTGDSPYGVEDIRRIARWSEGRAFTEARIQGGLSRVREDLQEKDFWQGDVSLTGRDHNPDQNLVTIVTDVRKGPRLRVRVDGWKLSDREMRRLFPIYEEGALDEDLLAEGASNLRNLLQSEGYFEAGIDYRTERQTEDEIEVSYQVEPGPRLRLAAIRIEGAFFFSEGTIRERMSIQESGFQFRRGRFSEALLAQDVQAIRSLYVTNGFRDVRITPRVERNHRGRPNHVAVAILIDEGEATFVESLDISGMDFLTRERRGFQFASAAGQPLSETSIAVDRDLILAEYFDAGYQDASFDWNVRPGSEPNQVIVEYRIREGGRLFVNDAFVSGIVNTRERLVEQQVLLDPGDPLSQTGMFETQRRLYDLGVFSKVDVGLQNPGGEEREKNVLIHLEEARRWTVAFGGGAEFARIGGASPAITRPVGEAAFSPRLTVETTRLNVRGMGHTLSFRTRVSNLQQRFLTTYEDPRWTGSEKWRMTLSGLYDTSRNVRTFTGTRAEGVFQLEHRLSKPSTALYRYTFRRTTIDEETLQISPLLVPLIAQPVRAALISGTYIQDRRDDPTDSSSGIFNSVDLSFASAAWGSQAKFFRFLGQNTTYHSLARRVVIARTLQLGMLAPFGDFRFEEPDPNGSPFPEPDARIPLAERFFAGGANIHRGFPVNQAGPRDLTTGFPLGGGAQLLNSVELRFPLMGQNIGGVIFYDAGNVYSKPQDISFRPRQRSVIGPDGFRVFEFDYLVHAVGFGLRYRTPIGPVRIDLAYSINPPRFVGFTGTREELLAGQGMRREQRIQHLQFHFSLGQTF